MTSKRKTPGKGATGKQKTPKEEVQPAPGGQETQKRLGEASGGFGLLNKAIQALTMSLSRLRRFFGLQNKETKKATALQNRSIKALATSGLTLRNWGDTLTTINSRFNRFAVSLKNLGTSITDVSTYAFQARDKLLGFGGTIASAIRSYSPAQAKRLEVSMGRFRATVGMILAPAAKQLSNLFVNLSKKLISLSKKMDIKKLIKWAVFGLLITIIAGLVLTFGLLIGGIATVAGAVWGFIQAVGWLGKSFIFGAMRAVLFGVQIAAAALRLGVAAIQATVFLGRMVWSIVWFAVRGTVALIRFAIQGTVALGIFVVRGTVSLIQFAFRGAVAIGSFVVRGLAALVKFAVSGATALARFAITGVTALATGVVAGVQFLANSGGAIRSVLVSVSGTFSGFVSGAVGALRGLIASISAFSLSATISQIAQHGLNIAHGIFAAITSPIVFAILQMVVVWLILGAVIWYFWEDIQAFFEQVWQGIKDFFIGIWEKITGWFDSVFQGVKGFLTGIWERIFSWFTGLKDRVKQFFDNIWNQIKAAWERVINFFKSIYEQYIDPFFRKIWDNVKWIWDKVSEFLKWLWNKIKWLFGGGGQQGDEQQQAQGPDLQKLGLDLDKLKNLGEDLGKALQGGPDDLAEMGAKMLEQMGAQGLAGGLRKFSKEFDALFQDQGGKGVPYEAKEGQTGSVEDLGKQAREAALGVTSPEKQTAEAAKKTAQNTESLSAFQAATETGTSFLKGVASSADGQTKETVSGFSQVMQRIEALQSNLGGSFSEISRLLGTTNQGLQNLAEQTRTGYEGAQKKLDSLQASLESGFSQAVGQLDLGYQDMAAKQEAMIERAGLVVAAIVALAKIGSQKSNETISALSRLEETQSDYLRSILDAQERTVEYIGYMAGSQRTLVDMERASRNSYRQLMDWLAGK